VPAVGRDSNCLGERAYSKALSEGSRQPFHELAAELLGESTPPSQATRDDPISLLTKREREVATLVAQGMSNKQVARTLVVSPRTAESHVEHILTKLGFTSRSQIAALVVAARTDAIGP
jgi:DNA-binding NarL/FixJ family response regulator